LSASKLAHPIAFESRRAKLKPEINLLLLEQSAVQSSDAKAKRQCRGEEEEKKRAKAGEQTARNRSKPNLDMGRAFDGGPTRAFH